MSEPTAQALLAELNAICREFEEPDGGPGQAVPPPPSPLSRSNYFRGASEAEIARRDDAKRRRGEICQALITLGPEAQPLLAAEVRVNPFHRLRANLIFVLGHHPTPTARDAIRHQSLIDRDENVLRKCIEGLARCGDREGIAAIARAHEGSVIGVTALMLLG